MPRNYVPKPGSKRFKKYDDVLMKQALDEITSTNNSLSAVAEKYDISKSVLWRHKNRGIKPHGRPTALTNEEELYVVENLNICGDWGYPLDTTDLRYIIKMYLDSMNIKHKRFKNNIPGIDYVNGFLKRHANKISPRICQNIKRSRAAVSPDTIKEYFRELEKSLQNVPTQNIINYDETNLMDDPGHKKAIIRRECKYPERMVNHSKGSISLMMSATADGHFLPPYVAYKATHLYHSWTMRGPHNARYNRSSSGWFDGDLFEDWVKTIVIPFLENKEGKKILIGDNLSSRLSIAVIKLCQEKDIHFIFLPSNSTHLTQPLHVAVFRPMKVIWRHLLDTLHKCTKSDDGRTQSCVPKGCFPRLLKLLLDELSVNAEKNIRAGFIKCGIVPLDADQVLARLPLQQENEEAKVTAVNDSFLKLLKEISYGSINIREPKNKRKLEVVAGRSVSAEEVELQMQIEELNEVPVELNDPLVIPETLDCSDEDMPISIAGNFDCDEIIVRTDDDGQKNQNEEFKLELQDDSDNEKPQTQTSPLLKSSATKVAMHRRMHCRPSKENEFEIFGRNVAAQLQKLPIDLALESQELVLSVLRRQRMKSMSVQSSTITLGENCMVEEYLDDYIE